MGKTTISVQLDDKVRRELEKRAKKEMLDLDDLIGEILRRSVLSYKKGTASSDDVDDKFLSYFTRKERVDYLKGLTDKFKEKFSRKKTSGEATFDAPKFNAV